MDRAVFIKRMARALYRGAQKTTHPISLDEAVVRAHQVADRLPSLFR